MSDFETHPVGTAKEIERLEAKVAKLKGLYLRDAGSCQPMHLAAALGNKPCIICGEDTWVKLAEQGHDD